VLKAFRLTLEDSVSDLDRLKRGVNKAGCDVTRPNVGLKVVRQLADVVRHDDWQITVSVVRRRCANEILEVLPGNDARPSAGLDVGTTTIVVYLVDFKRRLFYRYIDQFWI
jgi:uncharacterized 2Fe-2S/4Fe-4S cluster protein (DUF4445 family)